MDMCINGFLAAIEFFVVVALSFHSPRSARVLLTILLIAVAAAAPNPVLALEQGKLIYDGRFNKPLADVSKADRADSSERCW
jgi:hypothetical protein